MSDTTNAQAAGKDTGPTLTVVIGDPKPHQINGVSYRVWPVTYGNPATTIEIRELDEADQWDIAELAGDNLAENMGWMSRTMAAFATITINGAPLPGRTDRIGIRDTLRRLGRDGLNAAMQALAASIKTDDGVDPLATAKNS